MVLSMGNVVVELISMTLTFTSSPAFTTWAGVSMWRLSTSRRCEPGPRWTVAELDEGAERNDLGDLAVDDGSDRVGLDELNPRILGGLLETERDALTLQVDVENLDLDLVADLDDLGGMVDVVPGKLGDVHQAIDAAQIDERAEVDDRGNRALEAHALRELVRISAALVLAALLEQNAAGQNDVVRLRSISMTRASISVLMVHIEILDATEVDERSREEATQTDVENQAALDNLDDLAVDNLAGVELLLDAVPSTLVLGALLGQDQTTVLVLLLEYQSLDGSPRLNDVCRVSVLADGQLADRDNALGLARTYRRVRQAHNV